MTTAMTASSTRHAAGRANTGRSSRAPKPRAANQRALPSAGSGGELPPLRAVGRGGRAEQHHRVQVDVRVEPGERQAGADGRREARRAPAAVGDAAPPGRSARRAAQDAVAEQEDAPPRGTTGGQPRRPRTTTAPAPSTPAAISTRSESVQTATTAATCSSRSPCRSTKAFCAPMATISPRPRARPGERRDAAAGRHVPDVRKRRATSVQLMFL